MAEPDEGRRDDRRALPPVRHAARRGVRRGRHALRRPHRRGAVHPRDDRARPRRPPRRPARGSSTPAASTRSRPTSACSLLHEAAGEDLEETTYVVKAHEGRRRAAARSPRCKGQVDEMKARPPRSARSSATRTRSAPTAPPSPTSATSATCAASSTTTSSAWLGPFVMAGDQHARRAAQPTRCRTTPTAGASATARSWASATGSPGRAKATGVAGGIGGLFVGLALPPTRVVLDRVLPDAGRGPERGGARATGFFKIEIHGRTRLGQAVRREGRRAGRPRLRGDRGDARRERAVPGARPRRSCPTARAC